MRAARSRQLEHEMHEQARIIADLRALGASHHTVEHEVSTTGAPERPGMRAVLAVQTVLCASSSLRVQ